MWEYNQADGKRQEAVFVYPIIDTFPAFLEFWNRSSRLNVDDQIRAWELDYMSRWPDLLKLQIADYESHGLDWRQIARERIFPFLSEQLPAMQEAHDNLLIQCEPISSRVRTVLGFLENVVFVIYVGLGCGAGWATRFRGHPAVLLGLENIAECGWSDESSIRGLLAHEIGHLIHEEWRTEQGRSLGEDGWSRLFSEGFAQHCESLILDEERGHHEQDDWLNWCEANRGLLAREFLRRMDAGESVSDFFGSWLEIFGRSETGYFLGQKIMEELAVRFSLREIAAFDSFEMLARGILERM